MKLFEIRKNNIYHIILGIIALSIFISRTKDDSYSKKVDSVEFADFYKTSINGNIDKKEFFGRGGNYFSIEGDNKSYHFKGNRENTSKSFFNYVSIGDTVKKEQYSSEICVTKNINIQECFTYDL